MRTVTAAVLLLTVLQARSFAQQTTASSPPQTHDPLFLLGAEYSRLVQLSADAGILIPVADQAKSFWARAGDIMHTRRGIELSAKAGERGFQAAVGFGDFGTEGTPVLSYGFELLGTFGKLNSRATWPNSTYVGVDAGVTVTFLHASLGVAYRVKGDSSHSHWMFAPTVGVVIPFGRKWSGG